MNRLLNAPPHLVVTQTRRTDRQDADWRSVRADTANRVATLTSTYYRSLERR